MSKLQKLQKDLKYFVHGLNTDDTLVYKIPFAVSVCEADADLGCVRKQRCDVGILLFY